MWPTGSHDSEPLSHHVTVMSVSHERSVSCSVAPLFSQMVFSGSHSPAVLGMGGGTQGRQRLQCFRENTEQKLSAEGSVRWELIAWVLPLMSKIWQVCHISFYPLYKPRNLPRALPKPCFPFVRAYCLSWSHNNSFLLSSSQPPLCCCCGDLKLREPWEQWMDQMENHEQSEGKGLQRGTWAMCFSRQGEEGSEEHMSELDGSRLKLKGKMRQGRKR